MEGQLLPAEPNEENAGETEECGKLRFVIVSYVGGFSQFEKYARQIRIISPSRDENKQYIFETTS